LANLDMVFAGCNSPRVRRPAWKCGADVCGGATPYGLGMAERLSCDLASRGLVIFSGLARGVDAAAHRGRNQRQRQRHQQEFMRPQDSDQTGRQAHRDVEDVWEELPPQVRLALTPATTDESQSGQSASLFGETELPPHERKILKLLKAGEAIHIDETVESLEADLSSSEIFAALFELELAGKVKQMPGKNFVKSF
jgi:predicted Rossmann fold nucleotide-binding protein DprA/Smf involved in DNA uptake